MIDFDFLTVFCILSFIYCCFSPVDSKDNKKTAKPIPPEKDILRPHPDRVLTNELLGLVDLNNNRSKKINKEIKPTQDYSIKAKLEDKYKEILNDTDNYRTLESFKEFYISNNHTTKEEFDFVLKDIYGKYDRILLNLKNSENFFYEEDDFIVINIELLVFGLSKKTPIFIDKTKSATIQ